MANADQCRAALDQLGRDLAAVDPELRSRHVPERSVACRIKDLPVTFTARIDPDGLHDLEAVSTDDDAPPLAADVRISVRSDDLVALANGSDDVVAAWLHGRVQVSAPMRDILRLRSILSS
jgi:predicted lipid carrier protein YhbT